jgi:diguanylate cyclase (GGDEF)-like protein
MNDTGAGRTHAAPHPVIRQHYLPRTLAYASMALMLLAAMVETGFSWHHLALVPYCLAFPHLAHAWARRAGNDIDAEHRVLRMDSFNGALGSAWLAYALLPTTAMVLTMAMNTILVGGRRLFVSALPWVAAGALAGSVLSGYAFDWRSGPWTSAAGVLYIVVYALVVSFSAHANATRLRALKRELTAKSAALEQASLTDPLTGARNRRYVTHLMETSSQMAGSRRVAFALVDVDHFKAINDRHGHAAGDAVLRELAARLDALCAGRHELVRWGGEEFLLILVGVDPTDLPAFTNALRAAVVGRPFTLPGGGAIAVTVSTGLVARRGDDAAGLAAWQHDLCVADEALYRAKAAGRDRWVMVELDAAAPMVGPADALDSMVSRRVARLVAGGAG